MDENDFKKLIPWSELDNDLDSIPSDIEPQKLLEMVSSIVDKRPIESITNEDLKSRASKITLINNEMFHKYGIKKAWSNIITLQEEIDKTKKEMDVLQETKQEIKTKVLLGLSEERFDAYLSKIENLLPKLRKNFADLVSKQSDLMNKLGIKESVAKSVFVQINNNLNVSKNKKQNVIPADIEPI